MLPLLKKYADGKIYNKYYFADELTQDFNLNESEKLETVSSGKPKFNDRISWATTYLKKGGLLESPQRGYFQITERGRETLKKKFEKLTSEDIIKMYPDVLENNFYNPKLRTNKKSSEKVIELSNELTPDETL